MTVEVQCRSCNETFAFEASDSGVQRWRQGNELIQRALPELTADQRELLISGICGRCFELMFQGEDDE